MTFSLPYGRREDGLVAFDEPQRAAGQTPLGHFAAEPIPVVRVGIVGLGQRGTVAAGRLAAIEGVAVRALADSDGARTAAAARELEQRGAVSPDRYDGAEGWRALCRRDDLDLVYLCTPWQRHAPMACYAMEQGRHVAVEVPAAVSVAECWQLVNTAERTRRHCMMLENCLYDRFVLSTLRMAQEGLFGELLHAGGAYYHCLDDRWDDWRFDFNRTHRGDCYPTHGLGPACHLLGVHRCDRLDYLVAMDTPSVAGRALALARTGDGTFANGDLTATLLRTVRGRTIALQHDVLTPRPYGRGYQAVGSEGFAEQDPAARYLFDRGPFARLFPGEPWPGHEALDAARTAALVARYDHPVAAGLWERAREADPGRGGLNFLMDYRLVYCLRHGLPLDQSVYDAAAWSAVGELTALSLAHRSAPVAVPDFTRGGWQEGASGRYALEKDE